MSQKVAPGGLTAAMVLQRAIDFSQSGESIGINHCQKFVRTMFGSPGGAPTAVAAWSAAASKHPGSGNPPAGAAVYWGGGAGHVAISAGNGLVYSTDVVRPGKVDLVSIDWINKHWGKPYLGWSADNNGIRITKFDAKPVDPSTAVRGSGSPAGANVDTAAGTTAGEQSTTYSKKELASKFGFSAAFFGQSPELEKLIDAAVKGQWDETMFAARLQNTKWFKAHSESQRTWSALVTGDPAQARAKRAERLNYIQQAAHQMGVNLDPKRLNTIVEESLKFGWTEAQMQDGLASEFDYKKDETLTGQAGKSVDELRAMAASYGVRISDKTLDSWVTNILHNNSDAEGYRAYLRKQAQQVFPTYAEDLANNPGLTVADLAEPYINGMASLLEINPAGIDLFDPTIRSALQTKDPTTGKVAALPLYEFEKTLKKDTRWRKTNNARDELMGAGQQVLRDFGLTG